MVGMVEVIASASCVKSDDGIGRAVDVFVLSQVKVSGIVSEDGISGSGHNETGRLVTFMRWV